MKYLLFFQPWFKKQCLPSARHQEENSKKLNHEIIMYNALSTARLVQLFFVLEKKTFCMLNNYIDYWPCGQTNAWLLSKFSVYLLSCLIKSVSLLMTSAGRPVFIHDNGSIILNVSGRNSRSLMSLSLLDSTRQTLYNLLPFFLSLGSWSFWRCPWLHLHPSPSVSLPFSLPLSLCLPLSLALPSTFAVSLKADTRSSTYDG